VRCTHAISMASQRARSAGHVRRKPLPHPNPPLCTGGVAAAHHSPHRRAFPAAHM